MRISRTICSNALICRAITDFIHGRHFALRCALHNEVEFVKAWVFNLEFEKEAVKLRFRQRIGAFHLQRVLRRHDEEGQLEDSLLSGNGHGFFLHRF